MYVYVRVYIPSYNRVWEKFMAKIQQMLPPPGSGPPPSQEMMKEVAKKVLQTLYGIQVYISVDWYHRYLLAWVSPDVN